MNNVPAEYFFIDMTDGSRIGPISEMKFYEKMHSGEIRAETPVLKTGENGWSTFEYVREKWFPETRAQPVDHLTTDTSIASILSETWKFIFNATNFWLLLAGGVLWLLIDLGISFVISDFSTLVTGNVYLIVFLIFLRKWEYNQSPQFADLFPLKKFFFRPWLRALGAQILTTFACAIPLVLILGLFATTIAITYTSDEKFRDCIDRTGEEIQTILNCGNALSIESDSPKIEVQTEGSPASQAIGTETLTPPREVFFVPVRNLLLEKERLIEQINELTAMLANELSVWICGLLALPLAFASVFLSIRLGFAEMITLDTNAGILSSLKYSWQLTHGYFLKLIAIGAILLGTLVIGTFLTFGIAFIFIVPYSLAAWSVIYAKLLKARPEVDIPPTRL